MHQNIDKVWKALQNWPKKRWSTRNETYGYDPDAQNNPSGRLDFNVILKHFRENGPAKTYIGQPCMHQLSTGQKAVYVYIMPKYKLHFAFEKPEDMKSALGLALAVGPQEVESACIGPTGSYSIKRHRYLRTSFTAIYITEDKKVVDWHRHFVQGAGFSEHAEFVKALITKDFLQKFKDGPSNSKPSGGKFHNSKTKKSAYSEKLKEMLADPEPENKTLPEPSPKIVLPEKTIPQVLPFSAATPTECSLFKSALSCDPLYDNICLARSKEGRCKRARKCGNFCLQHAKMAKATDGEIRKSLFRALEKIFESVEKTSYDADLERAKKLSFEEYQKDQARKERSRTILEPLLKERKLLRIPIVGNGNCQFASVIASGKLDISPYNLRQEVVNYLRQFPELFAGFAAGFRNFNAYLNYMSQEGKWGDELTLLAISHLTLRPIHVLTDNSMQPVIVRKPPDFISSDSWGFAIVVLHQGEIHYEATVLASEVNVESHQDSTVQCADDPIEEVSENEKINSSSSQELKPTQAQLATAGHIYNGPCECYFCKK